VSPLDEVRFWLIMLEEVKRTIICSPEAESRIKSGLEARGLAGLNKVIVSRACPDGQVYIIDEGALEGYMNSMYQRNQFPI